jgi:hypothetical protein
MTQIGFMLNDTPESLMLGEWCLYACISASAVVEWSEESEDIHACNPSTLAKHAYAQALL